MQTLLRSLIITTITLVPLRAMFAQSSGSVTVADLMSFERGRFVEYNEYDTATSGAASTASRASYTVMATGLTYHGNSGVVWVRDSSAITNTATLTDLHYLVTTAGDLQIFADTTMISLFLPPSAIAGVEITAPNTFVDYLKMSAGINNSYPVAIVNGSTILSGFQINVKVTLTGIYRGIERGITVPKGTFDTTYRFDLPALVEISSPLVGPLGSFTVTQSLWLVSGIGIIKSNRPIAGTTILNTPIFTTGTEKEMTAYGIQGSNAVQTVSTVNSGIHFYPDPASSQISATFDRPAKRILFYAPTGQMIRSFALSSGSPDALLWVADIPNGVYYARIEFADGAACSAHIVVEH